MFNIANARFAFLDVETTGLSPWFGDRICQIAIVLTEGKRIKSTLDLLINPERSFRLQRVTPTAWTSRNCPLRRSSQRSPTSLKRR